MPRASPPRFHGWNIAWALAITQTVGFGILFYCFQVFTLPMEAELGLSRAQTSGAYSLALLLSGSTAIPVGRWVDRRGARGLMTTASLAGVVLLAYLVAVHPWWTAPMLELGQRIEGLRERDLRVRMELAQAPHVQQRLEEVREVASRVPGFMQERSAELATAALIARLETAVLEASPGNRSCAIRNRSPMSDPRQDRFRRALVQVRLHCGNPELAAVLHSLESGSPRLFVDNLNVLAPRQVFGRAGAGPQGAGLDITFDLYGYLQPQASSAGGDDAR